MSEEAYLSLFYVAHLLLRDDGMINCALLGRYDQLTIHCIEAYSLILFLKFYFGEAQL